MASRVVCISKSLGAGGEEIGRMVANKLGFRYTDREIILRAAEKAGVSAESAAQAEHTPGLITRILESFSSNPGPVVWWSYEALPSHALPAYQGLFEEVILETANRGNVVIVAHGASIPLASIGGLLRVLVTASPRVRAERLSSEANLSASEARKAVADSDRQRREFLRRFYNIRQELPTHYDLVINTDVLTPSQAARLVVSAAKGQQSGKRA
jgi:cytidylate kinase